MLRKQFYPVGFFRERWYKWFNLRQRVDQSVQEYTTEFQNQAMVLEITLEKYATFMKYISELQEYIQKELKMFSIDATLEASIKAIAIAGKLKK